MGPMPESLRAVGQLYPGKHELVTANPMIWEWFVKKPTRLLHEFVSPCGDNCQDRDDLYDNMFNHLKLDSGPTVPQGKTTLKLLDKINKNDVYIPSS